MLCNYHKGMKELYNARVKERTNDTKSLSKLKKNITIHEPGFSAYLCQPEDKSSPESIVKKSSFWAYAPMSQKWHDQGAEWRSVALTKETKV